MIEMRSSPTLDLIPFTYVVELPLFARLRFDWATVASRLLDTTICLPHKDGDIPSSETAGCFPHRSFRDERQTKKLQASLLKSLIQIEKGIEHKSIECEAVALTTYAVLSWRIKISN